MKGNSTWDTAFETLIDAFKSVYAYLDKQGLKPAGPSMTIYTQADDTGFQFQAAVPIAEAPKDMPKGDIAVGKSPGGKALKFVHRGSYDSMDTTYEAITNYLDEKRLEAQDLFVEEYATDPVHHAGGQVRRHGLRADQVGSGAPLRRANCGGPLKSAGGSYASIACLRRAGLLDRAGASRFAARRAQGAPTADALQAANGAPWPSCPRIPSGRWSLA